MEGLKMLLASSSNSEKLSMTIVGVLVMLAGIILPKANLGQNEFATVVDGMLNIGKTVITLAGMVATMWGGLRKIWNTVKDAYKK